MATARIILLLPFLLLPFAAVSTLTTMPAGSPSPIVPTSPTVATAGPGASSSVPPMPTAGGSSNGSVQCWNGVDDKAVQTFEAHSCPDSVEYDKQKCLKIECDFGEPHGYLVKKSCGFCGTYHDDWSQKELYSKNCKCYACDDKDFCNSAHPMVVVGPIAFIVILANLFLALGPIM